MGVYTETIFTNNVFEHLVVGFFFFFFAELANGFVISAGRQFTILKTSLLSSGEITLINRKVLFIITRSDERTGLLECLEIILRSLREGSLEGNPEQQRKSRNNRALLLFRTFLDF